MYSDSRLQHLALSVLAVLLASLPLLLGCATGGAPGQGGAANAPALTAEPSRHLPATPADAAALLRSADFSAAAGRRDGAETAPGAPGFGISVEPPALRFIPAAGGGIPRLSYATYALSLPGADAPAVLQLQWTTDLTPGTLYLALSDWRHNRWEILEATDPAQYSFDSLAAYCDGENRLLLALLVYGGPDARLEWLQFTQSAAPDAILHADLYEVATGQDTHLFAGYSTDDNGIAGYAWDLDGNGVFGEAGAEAASAGSITATGNYALAGTYRPAVRVLDVNGNSSDAAVEVEVAPDDGGGGGGGGNWVPTAQLSVSPCLVQQGIEAEVTLDAGGSTDEDGSIVDYGWDLDADGEFGEAGAEAEAAGQAVLRFPFTADSSADRTYAVRVTDNDGAAAGASGVLYVNGWAVVHLPAAGEVQSLAIAEIDAKTALAYSVETPAGAEVYYALAQDPNGETAAVWSFVKLGDYAQAPKLALGKADGWPSLALGIPGSDGPPRLEYHRAADPWGDTEQAWSGAGSAHVTLEQGSGVEADLALALAVVDGRPAIAYQRINPASTPYRTLYFTHSSSADGASAADWTAPVAVHSKADPDTEAGSFGYDCRLREIAGRPALAYLGEDAEGDRQLWYNLAGNAQGSDAGDWQAPLWISAEFDAPGDHPLCRLGGLSLIAGQVALSYSDPVSQQFRYRRATTPDGAAPTDWAAGENFLFPDYGEGQLFSMCVPMTVYVRYQQGAPSLWRATKGSLDGSSPDWLFDEPAYGPITKPADGTDCAALVAAPVANRIRAACLSADRREIIYVFWQ